ncbi:MAG: hypothetical protein ACOYB1_11740 [Limnohabitans sp.]
MYIDKRNFEPHASKNFYDLDKFEIFECAEHYLSEAVNASDSKTIVECLCYVRFLYSWHRLKQPILCDYTFDVLFCIIGHPSLDGDTTNYSPIDLAKIIKYDQAIRACVYVLENQQDDLYGTKLTDKKRNFLNESIHLYECSKIMQKHQKI